MTSASDVSSASYRISGRRGLTTISSVIVIVVVLALVAVTAYGIMGGFSPNGKPTCQPANSVACGQFANLHDLKLLIPFQSVQQGATVPFTVTVPSGESASGYTYDFGDGSPAVKSNSPTVSHIFNSPGQYLLSVQALVGGLAHDNYQSLVQLKVSPSFATDTNQNLPGVAGSVVSNGSTSTGSPSATAVLQPGESVTLGASYTSSPTNPLWREVPPTLQIPSGAEKVSTPSVSAVNATTTLRFATPGTYQVSFIGGASNSNNSNSTAPVVFQNFTWTVFVAATGLHAGVVGLAQPQSPHPGTILDYELAPGGARTEDPAIAYDTVSYEPILNVYQPLITYNGSSVGPGWESFVPALATCVPGSPECQSLYAGAAHPSLIDGWNYTFVINGASKFYDGRTGASWGVYPTDVMFSIARTLGFSTLPCVSCNNGWILAQALLSSGNATWDTIHQAFNNTPQNILGSMSINETGECPSAAMTSDHGCITFHAYGQHHEWPYFLELIADPLGGAVVPCGWFSAAGQGAGIPYWTSGNSTGAGDHPCQISGSGSYGVAPSSIPYQGWDQWETIGSGSTGRFGGTVQYSMVGSGPYYLSQYSVGLSYTLSANPSYVQNPYCTWTACQPKPGAYAHTIEVTWETDPTQGEQALASGTADFASVPATDLALILQLISQQKVNAISNPTLNVGFQAFDMVFSLEGAQRFSNQPITIKSDFFSYLGMRQFFAHAYPYTTIQNTINTVDGIVLGFNYGGAIPQFMGNYYPQNINWPSGDPCTDSTNMGCASFWWKAMHDTTSVYYDPEVAACTGSNPCEFPLFGLTGNPTGDVVNSLWAHQLNVLSGGGIVVNPTDINFVTTIINTQDCAATQCALPLYGLGWAPDYPDPTDYITPLYAENSTYTYGDAVAQGLYQPAYSSGCSQGSADYNYYANLTSPVPQSCQGVAYKSMIKLLGIAAQTKDGPYRVLLYDLAEKIANQLALYVYTSQTNGLGVAAAWVDIASLNTNPTMGAGGDTPFFWLTGNGLAA